MAGCAPAFGRVTMRGSPAAGPTAASEGICTNDNPTARLRPAGMGAPHLSSRVIPASAIRHVRTRLGQDRKGLVKILQLVRSRVVVQAVMTPSPGREERGYRACRTRTV